VSPLPFPSFLPSFSLRELRVGGGRAQVTLAVSGSSCITRMGKTKYHVTELSLMFFGSPYFFAAVATGRGDMSLGAVFIHFPVSPGTLFSYLYVWFALCFSLHYPQRAALTDPLSALLLPSPPRLFLF